MKKIQGENLIIGEIYADVQDGLKELKPVFLKLVRKEGKKSFFEHSSGPTDIYFFYENEVVFSDKTLFYQ